MKTLIGQAVFTAGGKTYCWEDVVFAAMAWGEWGPLREEARQGLACAKRMRETGESPTDEEMENALKEYRYRQSLISGEEVEVWLRQWGLGIVDWMKYVCMSLLRERWADRMEEITNRFPVTEEEIEGEVKTVGVCSGRLVSLCRKLAVRASIHERRSGEGGSVAKNAKDLLEAFTRNIQECGEAYGIPDAMGKRLKALACMEASYRDFCTAQCTPDAIRKEIQLHNIEWIRIDCLCLSTPDEQVAREAALCVREDGEGIGDVAARMGCRVREDHFYLEQVEPSLYGPFLCSRKGELVGPVHAGGNPRLFLIQTKVMPSDDDPLLRQRAQDAILDHLFDSEIRRVVRWETIIHKE
ncbi:MAG: hypothetical protein ACMUIL_05615 [bacterium]